MEQIVLIIHIFVAIGLISFVLMQRSEGGGTGFGGSSGSMTGFLSSRSKATILTKMTSYLAAAFICTSLLLAVLASRANEAETFRIDKLIEQEQTHPIEPATPTVPVGE